MADAKRVFALASIAVALMATGCAKKEAPVAEEPVPAPEPVIETQPVLIASAQLQSRADLGITGNISFTQEGDAVTIAAHVEGAEPGLHGLHVHEVGDCSAEDFTSAGGHFNPTEAPHGAPADHERHAGDLGNVEVGAGGMAHMEMTTTMLSVEEGPNSVLGKAVILHEKEDDLVSQPTGAAGGRIACGVVELVSY